jgi:hypothetical protein
MIVFITSLFTLQNILSFLFLVVAGLANGIMDSLQFHFGQSWFKDQNQTFWNPSLSWRNKYKNDDPEQGPKFFGSTTVFVFLTDGWHLVQFLMYLSFCTAVAVLFPLIWWKFLIVLIAARVAVQVGFLISYR